MNTLVIKLGGHALESLEPDAPVLRQLANDIVELRAAGTRCVVVHGGGPQIAELLERAGVPSRFHEGLRVTDELTMRYVAMALGEVNMRIVAALEQAGLECVGLCGTDRSVLRAQSLGEPWERAGGAPEVGARFIESLWGIGLTPVISPVSVDAAGHLLNCNADTAAGALAGELRATALVLLSDIDQLRADPDDPNSALDAVTSDDVRRLVETGAARDGMRPKMTAALDALEGGATRIVMANGTRPHALRHALDHTIPTTEVVR